MTTIKLKDGISQEDLIKVETEMRRQYPNAVTKLSDTEYSLPGDLHSDSLGTLATLIEGFAVSPQKEIDFDFATPAKDENDD